MDFLQLPFLSKKEANLDLKLIIKKLSRKIIVKNIKKKFISLEALETCHPYTVFN